MKRMVYNEREIYKIEINKAAIEDIERLYKDGTYIPTPLTFNIPMIGTLTLKEEDVDKLKEIIERS